MAIDDFGTAVGIDIGVVGGGGIETCEDGKGVGDMDRSHVAGAGDKVDSVELYIPTGVGVVGPGEGGRVAQNIADSEVVDCANLNVGEVAPSIGSLVGGEATAGDIDGDVGGNIGEHIVPEYWRGCGKGCDFRQAGAVGEGGVANGSDAAGNGNGRKPKATIKRFVTNRSDSVGNYCIHASYKQLI